jgi:hypothetical protein
VPAAIQSATGFVIYDQTTPAVIPKLVWGPNGAKYQAFK